MRWWREHWCQDDPLGIPYVFWLLAHLVAETSIPLAVIASLLIIGAAVEPWVAVLGVLTGWPVAWRLYPTSIRLLVKVGVAAVWLLAGIVLIRLLGPLPTAVVMIAASPHAVWAIDRLEDRKREARMAEDIDGKADHRGPRS